MQPQVATHHSDLVDFSALSYPDLEGLGRSAIAAELRELLLEPDEGEEEEFARFDNSTASPRRGDAP